MLYFERTFGPLSENGEELLSNEENTFFSLDEILRSFGHSLFHNCRHQDDAMDAILKEYRNGTVLNFSFAHDEIGVTVSGKTTTTISIVFSDDAVFVSLLSDLYPQRSLELLLQTGWKQVIL